MKADLLVAEFFRAADQLNPEPFAQLLTEEVAWTFGNAPTIRGRTAVIDSLSSFFQLIRGMKHRLVGVWSSPECVIAETRVQYDDRFGRTFEFAACNIFFFSGELIREVRIFCDNHDLFVPPDTASAQR